MSERGSRSRRPKPPTAATAVPGGAPARANNSPIAASTRSMRRRAAHTLVVARRVRALEGAVLGAELLDGIGHDGHGA